MKPTALGRDLSKELKRGALLAILFHVAGWHCNLGCFGRGLHGAWPQRDIGVILWSLSVAAWDWESRETLTRLCAIPINGVLETSSPVRDVANGRRDCRSRSNANSRKWSPARILCRCSGKALRRQRPSASLEPPKRRPRPQGAERARRRNRASASARCSCRSLAARRRSQRQRGRSRRPVRARRRANVKAWPKSRAPIPGGFFITTKPGALRDGERPARPRWRPCTCRSKTVAKALVVRLE